MSVGGSTHYPANICQKKQKIAVFAHCFCLQICFTFDPTDIHLCVFTNTVVRFEYRTVLSLSLLFANNLESLSNWRGLKKVDLLKKRLVLDMI